MENLIEEIETFKIDIERLAKKTYGNATWNKRFHDINLITEVGKLANTKANYSKGIEDYNKATQDELKNKILSAIDNAGKARLEVNEKQWAIQLEDFNKQYEAWKSQVNEILNIGSQEWTKAEEKVNAGYNTWQRNFIKEYKEKSIEWEQNYAAFLVTKHSTQALY